MSLGPAGRGRGRAFVALRSPVFAAWFAAQILAASGVMTQVAGMSWLTLELGGGVWELAWVGTAGLIPILVGSPWGGLLADRLPRRGVLMATQCAYVVLGLFLAFATVSGVASVTLLVIVSFVTGAVTALDAPARQVFVMDLVGPERLTSAISLQEIVINGSRVVGPAVGGVLIASAGPAACFLVNGLAYLVPLAVLLFARTRSARSELPVATNVWAGVVFTARQPMVRAVMIVAIPTTVIFNTGLLYPLWTRDLLEVDASGYGILMAAFGLGALPGALAAASIHDRPSWRATLVLGAVTGVVFAVLPYLPQFWQATVGMATVGFASIWFATLANTLLQLSAPPELRGRVMGIWTMIVPGAGVLTYPLIGIVTDSTGTAMGFVAVGIALVVTAAVGWLGIARTRPAAGRLAP
ncbi:MAG: MFS transporter [Mycetocola sp.]